MSTRYFRAGVGTVIYRDDNSVVIFERATYPIGVWEFQQGGIDRGEQPSETLWRELKEEVGLTEDDIETVHELPEWTVYETKGIEETPSEDRLGQAHRWYFLKLKNNVQINLSDATQEEASDYKWVQFEEAISFTGEYKRHVYEHLHKFFKELRGM